MDSPKTIEEEAIESCIALAAQLRKIGNLAAEQAALEAAETVLDAIGSRAADAAKLKAKGVVYKSVLGLDAALSRLDKLRAGEL